jgi:predicted nucleotidyltransferase
MDDATFQTWLSGELADLPGLVAVSLGGSRARGTHRPDSDWDLAVYYRGHFDPELLRDKGWSGHVTEVGGWGGGVMNGGAWLTIDGRRVDVHYRDLDEVEHWCDEAEAGRYEKEFLLFYVAGIPTYVVMAELATHRVLSGLLPRPGYPDALAVTAARRWHEDAQRSLAYAAAALESRSDVAVAMANTGRGLIEAAHSVLARRREWVTNEKGMVARAGLDGLLPGVDAGLTSARLAAIIAGVKGLN